MSGNIVKNNRWLDFALTLIVCFLCLGTTYRHTSMIAMILLLLCLGFAWFLIPQEKQELKKNERLFLFSLVFFFLSALVSYIVGSGWELRSIRNPSMPSLIDLDLPSKYLLGALLFFLFVKLDFKICKKGFFYALGVGAILNGCVAIYERYMLGVGRVDGWSGIAEMADASAILGIFALILFIFSTQLKERIFYFIASFMGCFAVILTGTRGAMLGVIASFVFVGIMTIWKRRELFRALIGGLFVGICVFGVSWLSSDKGADIWRLKSAESDLVRYQNGEIDGNSIGARFEMWKEAFAMFQMAPIFGLSTAEIKQNIDKIQEKSQSKIIRQKTHQEAIGNKHNQILNQAAKRGIVGVIAILMIWWAWIKMFATHVKNRDEVYMIALCALSMIFYFIFPNSFTGEPWESNATFPMMVVFICVFWKMISRDLQDAF